MQPVSGEERQGGLEHIREILFGDVVRELERRLSRLDSAAISRAREVQQDGRRRAEVLEAHVRRETEAIGEAVRTLRQELRDALAQVEARLGRLESQLEGSIARVERELRHQLLEQASSFLDQLERTRHQLRAALARELGLEPDTLDEASPDDGEAQATHH